MMTTINKVRPDARSRPLLDELVNHPSTRDPTLAALVPSGWMIDYGRLSLRALSLSRAQRLLPHFFRHVEGGCENWVGSGGNGSRNATLGDFTSPPYIVPCSRTRNSESHPSSPPLYLVDK
jgi:hypothetical protein